MASLSVVRVVSPSAACGSDDKCFCVLNAVRRVCLGPAKGFLLSSLECIIIEPFLIVGGTRTDRDNRTGSIQCAGSVQCRKDCAAFKLVSAQQIRILSHVRITKSRPTLPRRNGPLPFFFAWPELPRFGYASPREWNTHAHSFRALERPRLLHLRVVASAKA